jgi:transcriptional antiterminator NusG
VTDEVTEETKPADDDTEEFVTNVMPGVVASGPELSDAEIAEEIARYKQGEGIAMHPSSEKAKLVPTGKKDWYVVQTYSGFEMRVKTSLEERIRQENMQEFFGEIVVPQETVEERVGGNIKTSKRKFFPGYILVNLELNEETWHMIKNTPKVAGFIGDSRTPPPLSPEEVTSLMGQIEGTAKRTRPKKNFEIGDSVKLVDGPFAEFNAIVDDVKPDKGKIRVLISIFGRSTPMELDFEQVEKV